MAENKQGSGWLAALGMGVLKLIGGAAVVCFGMGILWLVFGTSNPYPSTDKDRVITPKQPVEKVDPAPAPKQGLKSLEGIGKAGSDTPTLDELKRKYGTGDYPQHIKEGYVPSDVEIEEAVGEVFGTGWVCTYAPTMNGNWHDDVHCSIDSNRGHRPNLLADWGFVTEADMRAAAQDYEDYLNAGGTP